jgi:hypothetical protein
MSRRNDRRRDNPSSKYLTIWTSCGPDTQVSGPFTLNYSASMRKIIISDAGNKRLIFFEPNGLYASKRYGGVSITGADTDSSNLYWCSAGYVYKDTLSLNGALSTSTSCNVGGSTRQLSAASLTNHVIVSSGNSIYLVNKSTMTVATSLGGFNLACGTVYYGGYIYASDYSNNRVVRIIVDDVTPSLTWDTSYATSYTTTADGIETDGTYIYLSRFYNGAAKLSMDCSTSYYSTSAEVVDAVLVPNAGDGADGTNPTLWCMNNTNSTVTRRKSSDLTLIDTICTSGDGSSSSFDPVVAGVAGTWKMDDGSQVGAAAGGDISWNGFAGYTFKTPGTHKVVFKPSIDGAAAITAMNIGSDSVLKIKNKQKTRATSINVSANYLLETTDLFTIPYTTTTMNYDQLITTPHYIKDVPRTVSTLTIGYGYKFYGSVSDIPDIITSFTANNMSGAMTSGSIASKTAIQSMNVQANAWAYTSVDTVLLSASDATWTNLNHYSYSSAGNGPTLQIAGTNAAPGGTAGASTTNPMTTPGSGNSDTDWSWKTSSEAMLLGNITTTALTTNTLNNTNAWSQRFMAMPGDIDTIKLYTSGSTNVKLALYSDTAGAPVTVLAQTGSTAVVPGWNTVSLGSTVTLTAGTYYHLVVQTEDANRVYFGANGTGPTSRYWTKTYADAYANSPSAASTYTNLFGIAGYGSGHKALTGQAACWYLANATGTPTHKWTITKT